MFRTDPSTKLGVTVSVFIEHLSPARRLLRT